MEQYKNISIGCGAYPSYDVLQNQCKAQQAQIEILTEMARGWEALCAELTELLDRANELFGPASETVEALNHKLLVEERHSEKRRVEITRMQEKLRNRRQQVKHLLEVIDLLQNTKGIQGSPSAVGLDRRGSALTQHVNHGQKGAWTYSYSQVDDTVYLQVDAQQMTTAYLDELLRDLADLKLQVSAYRKRLKVDLADVSVLTSALKEKGYNDEAVRDLIKTLREVK